MNEEDDGRETRYGKPHSVGHGGGSYYPYGRGGRSRRRDPLGAAVCARLLAAPARFWPSRWWAFSCCTGRRASSSRRTTAAWEALNAAHQAAEAFLGEPENSLDALFIGDSETYSALSPVEIWKDAGIPSYTCAIGKQYLTYSKSLLNRALAVQNPKVVMIEGNSLFRPFDEQKLVKTAVKDAFPIFERHDRWKALTPEDFVAAPENTWVDDMKGFRLKWGIRPADSSKYMASDERVQEVPELTMTVLRQMADACHADGAQMVLIATPSTKNWSQARHNGMVKVAEELGIDWIDLNTGDDEVAIDWDTDTRDYGDHLNYYGATKASRAVANILRDRYGLQDHRADGGDTYRHWNRAVRAYERQIEEAEHFNATCLAPLGSDLRATLPLEG